MGLPRTVRTLGLVSLLTDAGSEMIYPLLPAFVTTVLGAGPAFLGLVEGAAEATAAVWKVVAGRLSDRAQRRKPLIVAGYGLSSAARPLLGLATQAWHVLAVRLADRTGKGTRGAPRDALIAEVTPAADRGRAFGFHRAMDHAGACVGPLLASAALALGAPLRVVFALAAIPGLLSVLVLVLGVREEPAETAASTPADGRAPLGGRFALYLGVLALFTLGNSSDAFLLLRAQETGLALGAVPLLWAFHHAVKALTSTWGGALSDRLGRRRTIVAGWFVFALAYAGFAVAHAPWHAWALFALYALFPALSEGPERALVADLAGRGRGRAFGLYHAVTGAMLLPASLLTGWIWQARGPAAALGLGAALSALAAAALLLAVREPAG